MKFVLVQRNLNLHTWTSGHTVPGEGVSSESARAPDDGPEFSLNRGGAPPETEG